MRPCRFLRNFRKRTIAWPREDSLFLLTRGGALGPLRRTAFTRPWRKRIRNRKWGSFVRRKRFAWPLSFSFRDSWLGFSSNGERSQGVRFSKPSLILLRFGKTGSKTRFSENYRVISAFGSKSVGNLESSRFTILFFVLEKRSVSRGIMRTLFLGRRFPVLGICYGHFERRKGGTRSTP